MDALTNLMEDALLESDKETVEMEVPAPQVVPVPNILTPAPIDSLEMPVLPVTNAEVSSEPSTSGQAAALQTSTSKIGEHSGSNRSDSSKSKCMQCKGKHPLYKCASFRKLNHAQKLRFVVLHRHCYRCLSTQHIANDCKSPMRCNSCNEKHHTLLHGSNKGLNKKVSESKGQPSRSRKTRVKALATPAPAQVSTIPLRHAVSLSPTLKVNLLIGTRRILVRAVLDLCCSMSYVCSSLVHQLSLPVSTVNKSQICRLTISSIYPPYPQITLTANVKELLGIRTPAETISNEIITLYNGMQLADPNFYHSGNVALVLGPELSNEIVKGKIHSSPGIPLAQYTLFGWVLSGQSPY